jgi:2-haloacid dehalogenase
VVDDGARRALVSQGRSLLAAGVRSVDGTFDADVAVEVVDAEGRVFAKGLTRYAAPALRAVAGRRADDAAVAHVMDGFAALPASPDAEPALRRLADAGVPAVCLTNGAAATTAAFLERAGLTGLVDRVISVEEVGRWKPPPIVYRHAAAVTGVPGDRIALVAAHAWDCHGAKRAGLSAGWVSRLEGRYGEVFEPPDVTGDDLVEVVDRLLALDGG